ncbi:monovalent cation:proton antiporter-2 (CPA2) family protein [Pseudomonas schmalbachii]|uniref:Cation:proton antiporter n=1 Tax=Pseudomonas schmalbachii TaxID=2816993 RepID=A0ABS3TPY8_9PSED|nr:monovalent cation:proton antiporter-2 (CPA2) family protein [Pseudomonas schmalbachii]MBO3275726.1 cation:proton antiporter [Pseudomonas schmalbachii]
MHEDSYLTSAVVFMLAAVFMVPLAKRLQLGSVLGYLLAGVLIGPSVLGLISNPGSVSNLSELGVVLLLFIIGLELSPKRLWVMRRSVFGVGLLQVLLCAAAIGVVALFFGLPRNTAVVVGGGLALSSTAFGLQILAERKQLTAPYGRLAFAILLFQDIAAIPLIAMIPFLGAHADETVPGGDLAHLLEVVGSIAVVVIGGRYLLRPVFRTVARTGQSDLSTATALLVVVGTAWLMEVAGVSMGLGAFLAGVLLADSEYRHELESQLEPFKGLLLGLFFIGVGMSADLSLLGSAPLTVIGLTLLLILLKLPLIYWVGRLVGGLDKGGALRLGLVLAAGGEFAFVVFKLSLAEGLLSAAQHDMLVLTITLSMALTPLMVLFAARMARNIPAAPQPEPPAEYRQIVTDEPRVVIAGMGRMGQVIARILRAQGVPFVALDTSVDAIELQRSFGGMPIYYGDPLRPEILRAVKVDKAEFFVVATNNPETNMETARLVRRMYPHVKVIARARNRQHVYHLLDMDAKPVRETFHSSLEMSRMILLGIGLSEEQAQARIRRFKQHDEEVLMAQYAVYDDEQAVVQTTREARADLENLFAGDLQEQEGVGKP